MARRLLALLIGLILAVSAFAVWGGASTASASNATPARSIAPAAVKLTIKNPSTKCAVDRKHHIIQGPANRTSLCTYYNLVLGHAYPKPKKAGYLQQVVKKLKVGNYVRYQGKTYKVKGKYSVKKTKLVTVIKSLSSSDRYLVTCDTTKGYKNHHAIYNLVARLVRA